jgi:hypothetical protein
MLIEDIYALVTQLRSETPPPQGTQRRNDKVPEIVSQKTAHP